MPVTDWCDASCQRITVDSSAVLDTEIASHQSVTGMLLNDVLTGDNSCIIQTGDEHMNI